MLEQHGTGNNMVFFTDSTHWDCQCDKNYIHTQKEKECKKCGVHREVDSAPDARLTEIHSVKPLSALAFQVYAEGYPHLAYKYQPKRFWKYMKKNYPAITKIQLKRIMDSLNE